MALGTIDVHEAAALTIIADYPEMPDGEFQAMVGTLRTEEARRLAKEIRTPSKRDDSKAFRDSVAASVGV
jgi:hypothetical protein